MSRGPSLSSPWDDWLVEELKRLWAEGYSATDIAWELRCVSRNAVIGKVNRLGLERRKPRRKARKPRDPRKRGKPIVRRPVFIAPHPSPQPPQRKPEPQPPKPPPPKPRNLVLLQLQDHHCRWPVNDASPFKFCGAYRASGKPYCRYHMGEAFAKPRRP